MDGVVAVVRDVAAGGEKLGGRTPARVVVGGGGAVVGGRLAARYWGASYDCTVEAFARRACCTRAALRAGSVPPRAINAALSISVGCRRVTVATIVVLATEPRQASVVVFAILARIGLRFARVHPRSVLRCAVTCLPAFAVVGLRTLRAL